MRAMRWFTVLTVLFMAFRGLPSAAQDAAATTEAAAPPPATIDFMNREIATLRGPLAGATPDVRAQRAERLFERLDEGEFTKPLDQVPIRIAGTDAIAFRLGDRILFMLTPGDLDPADERPLKTVADATEALLAEAIAAHRESRHWPTLLRGLGLSVIATLVLGGLVWATSRLRSRLHRLVQSALAARIFKPSESNFDWTGAAYHLTGRIVQVLAIAAVLGLFYLWLVVVLEQFPLTRPLGDRLGSFLLDLLENIGRGFLAAIPGLIAIVVIFLIARALQDLVGRFFDAVQLGQISMPGLHPDTAGATRRMMGLLIWVIALTFAYPYIPGSQSDIFKGLSVLFGFMITLGSAGVVNQWMSGAVLIYSRALRKGDLVKVGDTTGVVQELNALSVKLVNHRNEEITLPNALVVGNTIINYTREDENHDRAYLTTSVTIGYDAPWRQVHALLLTAAAKTAGIRKTPPPHVLQRALSDFYVEYELCVQLEDPLGRAHRLSDLHANIQDEFNSHGVQIMSPHFEGQPDRAVVVPREKWHEPPAAGTDGKS